MVLPLSSTTICVAQSSFTQVLLKSDCTCISAFTVIVLGEAEAIVDWDSLIGQKHIEEIWERRPCRCICQTDQKNIYQCYFVHLFGLFSEISVLKIQVIVQPLRFPTLTGWTTTVEINKNISFKIKLGSEITNLSRCLEKNVPQSDILTENMKIVQRKK